MIDDVVSAAWELVHEHGLAGLSMRDLGEKVGMHASSIYQYFPSKLDIYDALFAHGHRQLQAVMGAVDREGDPEDVFRAGSAVLTNSNPTRGESHAQALCSSPSAKALLRRKYRTGLLTPLPALHVGEGNAEGRAA